MSTATLPNLVHNFDINNTNKAEIKRFTSALNNAATFAKGSGDVCFVDEFAFGCLSGETDGRIILRLGLPSVIDRGPSLDALAHLFSLADDISIAVAPGTEQLDMHFVFHNIIREPVSST